MHTPREANATHVFFVHSMKVTIEVHANSKHTQLLGKFTIKLY